MTFATVPLLCPGYDLLAAASILSVYEPGGGDTTSDCPLLPTSSVSSAPNDSRGLSLAPHGS